MKIFKFCVEFTLFFLGFLALFAFGPYLLTILLVVVFVVGFFGWPLYLLIKFFNRK